MSLKRVNFIIAMFLTIIISGTFLYTYHITKRHFIQEHITRIKGDVLELGYAVANSMEKEETESSLNLLYISLATHKEYQAISIAIGDKIVVSTDKKQINKLHKNDVHIDELQNGSLKEDVVIFHEFVYYDKKKPIRFNLIIDLNDEYLKASEKDVQKLIKIFAIYFILIMAAFVVFFYFSHIRPLMRLKKIVNEQELLPSKFFIKEYSSLYNSFLEKYNEIALLNKTLEDKIVQRTKLLTKTNALFKEAQRLTHLGNWEWNISDNSIVWSDEIYTIFGLKLHEFPATYEYFIDSVHVDDRAMVQAEVKKALETGKEYSITHRVVLPDASEKVVYEKGSVEFDSSGKPIRMIGTVQDITQRYKRGKELELQSKLLNSVADSIFAHNLDGSFIYVNEAAYTTRGYTKEELMSMKVQDLNYTDDMYKEKIKNIQQEVQDKGSAIFEISDKTKNGTVIPLEVTTRLIHEDKKSYMISIARNISERKALYKNLEVSERKYRMLVENSQIGIFNININGEMIYANTALVKIMGYKSLEDFYKYKVTTMYKNIEQHTTFLLELMQNGKVEEMEITVLTKDNKEKIVLISAHLEGDIISGIIMDITEAKKAIEEITKLSRAIEEIDDVIMISDREGVMTFVNDAYVKHTGFSREESVGKTAAILKSGKQDKDFYKNMWDTILSGNVFRGLFINKKRNTELYYEEKTITPIKNDAGEITSFVSAGKDITQRIKMQNNLELLASTDKLTGIYNRHKFEELFKIELERVSRYKNPLALIMLDIDHFKDVNDTYGHDIGDKVLKNVVAIAKKNIRSTDIFARWGGEEFLILCPETDTLSAQTLAEKLRKSIETTIFDAVGSITCSFGVSVYADKESGESLIKRVDSALYQAKHEGRNRVVVI